MSRVAQLTDPVTVEVRLPPITEEWVLDVVMDFVEDVDDLYIDGITGEYVIGRIIHGNCNAIMNAESFLRDLQEAFSEGNIDPMAFTLKATAQPSKPVNRE